MKVCSDAVIGTEETNVIDYRVEAFPCDECGAKCTSFDDLGRHRTTYHHGSEIVKENLALSGRIERNGNPKNVSSGVDWTQLNIKLETADG